MFLQNDITTVWLVLGNRCNCNCRYCSQHDLAVSCIRNDVNPEIYPFLKKIAAENSFKPKIIFYGGEPLLYYENLKEVIAELGDSFCYKIITNGKLLTSDVVEYCNRYNISVQVSWDGDQSIKSRNYDVIVDNKDNVLALNDLKIHTMFTHYSSPKKTIADVQGLDDEYIALHGYCFDVEVNYLVPFGGKDKYDEVYDVNLKRLSDETDYFCYKYFNGIDVGSVGYRFIDKWVNYYQNFWSLDNGELKLRNRTCTYGIHGLNMDLMGNLYSCHNESVPIATIKTLFIDYLDVLLKKDFNEKHFQKCKVCPVLPICRGGCKAMKYDELYCNVRLAAFNPIIRWIEKGDKNYG